MYPHTPTHTPLILPTPHTHNYYILSTLCHHHNKHRPHYINIIQSKKISLQTYKPTSHSNIYHRNTINTQYTILQPTNFLIHTLTPLHNNAPPNITIHLSYIFLLITSIVTTLTNRHIYTLLLSTLLPLTHNNFYQQTNNRTQYNSSSSLTRGGGGIESPNIYSFFFWGCSLYQKMIC